MLAMREPHTGASFSRASMVSTSLPGELWNLEEVITKAFEDVIQTASACQASQLSNINKSNVKTSPASTQASQRTSEQHSEEWNLGYGAGYQMATEDLRVTVDRTLRPNDAADLKAALEAAK